MQPFLVSFVRKIWLAGLKLPQFSAKIPQFCCDLLDIRKLLRPVLGEDLTPRHSVELPT
jgi:hypothetical protein